MRRRLRRMKKSFFLSPKTNFFLIEFKLSEFIHPFSLDVWNATSRSFSRLEVNITKYFTIVALTILRLKKKIEEMQKQLDEIKMAYDAKLASQEAKFSKGMSDISDVLVQLLSTPSANATEQPKERFNVHVEKKEDKISRFLDFAKSIK